MDYGVKSVAAHQASINNSQENIRLTKRHNRRKGFQFMIERMHSSERMSKIVKHNGTVYLCGQVGVAGTSIKEQTEEMLSRVDSLLKQANSDKTHILQAIIWLADMKYFAEMNQVWDAWIDSEHAPARACGEAKLARPELLVEIIITAAEISAEG
jgi:enamine deaminase RidA (YjgF/YER057c/UK114 family)